jgi:beta-1,4-mannosyl-glycoprotein beta-1,4-N-acetylglucosaminyltransferase
MLYDCFLFFDELELLDLRLHYLDPLVDRFVLVESTKTFSMKDKPLFFEENRSMFSKFLPKIEHVIIDDMFNSNPWDNEKKQRDGIMKGLTKCSDDDIIVFSDCDEIPRLEAFPGFDDRGPLMGFRQEVYYYYFNGLTDVQWCGSKICRYKNMVKASPTKFRDTCLGGTNLMIPNGGWHFSFLGNSEKLARKIRAFSHQEYNFPEYTDPDKLQKRIDNAIDLFSRKEISLKYVPMDSSFPFYLLENRDKFRHLIKDVE